MIIAVNDIFELDKILRNYLISQTGLDNKNVINALSVRGPELEVLISEHTYFSPSLNDTILIFENESNDTNNNISMTEDINNISIYQSFKCKIIIYGNYSKTLALLLKARFESEVIRDSLFSDGINLEKISNPISINELKNETVWIRTDLAIEYSCRLLVANKTTNEQIKEITKLTIIKED